MFKKKIEKKGKKLKNKIEETIKKKFEKKIDFFCEKIILFSKNLVERLCPIQR